MTRISESMESLSHATGWFGGLAGTVVFALLCAVARGFRWSSFEPEMMLGSFITGDIGTAAWGVGVAAELFVGGILGLVYGAGFHAVGHAGAGVGARFGILHWIVSGILLGVLPVIHPMIPERASSPGFFGLNLDVGSFLAFLVAHLAYGSVVGVVYRRYARDRAARAPATPGRGRRRAA